MKQIFTLLAVICSFGASAQNNWNLVGGVGAGMYKTNSIFHETSEKTYFDVNIGARYNIGLFYLQSGLAYMNLQKIKIKDLQSILSEQHGHGSDPAIAAWINSLPKKQSYFSIPLMIGFNYKNPSIIYPFAQIGLKFNLASDGKEEVINKFNMSFVGKLGAGFNVSNSISLEPSFVFERMSKVWDNFGYGQYPHHQLIGGQVSVVLKL